MLLSWFSFFRNDKKVAIKIVRRDKADYEDAVLEAKIIQQLQSTSSGPEKWVLHCCDMFVDLVLACRIFNIVIIAACA